MNFGFRQDLPKINPESCYFRGFCILKSAKFADFFIRPSVDMCRFVAIRLFLSLGEVGSVCGLPGSRRWKSNGGIWIPGSRNVWPGRWTGKKAEWSWVCFPLCLPWCFLMFSGPTPKPGGRKCWVCGLPGGEPLPPGPASHSRLCHKSQIRPAIAGCSFDRLIAAGPILCIRGLFFCSLPFQFTFDNIMNFIHSFRINIFE